MAAYFIDLLKYLHPRAVLLYFFCRSGRPGLTNAIDILRTFTQQAIRADEHIRGAIAKLKLTGFKIDEKWGIAYGTEKAGITSIETG